MKRDPDGTIKRAAAILAEDFKDFVILARPVRDDGPVMIRKNTDPIWTMGAMKHAITEMDEQARHMSRLSCCEEDE